MAELCAYGAAYTGAADHGGKVAVDLYLELEVGDFLRYFGGRDMTVMQRISELYKSRDQPAEDDPDHEDGRHALFCSLLKVLLCTMDQLLVLYPYCVWSRSRSSHAAINCLESAMKLAVAQ